MENKPEEPKEETKNDYTGYLVMFVIFSIFAGYIALEWFFGGSTPDCAYTNLGCQGDSSRFGQ